ncbi:MAG TPA: sulfotransferase family 2 domain-containing protein [Xanthomonadales bacterium]|nr:sulfotransferase family 2 domain-containing protein [Xanthomonadales bacterium]
MTENSDPKNESFTTIQKPDYVRSRLKEMGFWFVDIPRTSSTSLRLAFYGKYGKLFGKPSASQGIGMGLIPPHVPARLLREQVGAALWDSLYTFSIVRNPFERALSLFQFLQKNSKLKGWTYGRYVDQLVRPGGFDYHGHYLSNCGYLCDADGALLVKEVFRFEQREQAMNVIAARTDCPEIARNQTRTYATGLRHYSHYYDALTRRKIEDFYRDDLERFGYRFEPEVPS